jgi:FKBP-type peptidyl-prolyl cis-trans isomerase FkpA
MFADWFVTLTALEKSGRIGLDASRIEPMTDQLKVEDLNVGTGVEATAGKQVTVHYVGTLTDGKKFDSSRDRGKGFSFRLGGGQVIKGWDQGVAGMKVGGLRRLTIPSDLAYGDRGFPPVIPAKATLVFEVELLSVD